MSDMEFNPSAGKELAKAGAQRAADNAERKSPGWNGRALDWLLKFAVGHPQGFLCEDVRKAAYESGFEAPPNERAWGNVMTRAKHLGLIRADGFAAAKDKKVHGSMNTFWKPNAIQ